MTSSRPHRDEPSSEESVRRLFARNLAAARAARRLGQKQLAGRVGVHTSTISKYECGESLPGLEVLGRLADVLDLSCDALAGRTGRAHRSAEVELRLDRLAELIEQLPAASRAAILRAVDEIETEVRKVLRRA